jgi:hypothetical protein
MAEIRCEDYSDNVTPAGSVFEIVKSHKYLRRCTIEGKVL